MIKLKDPKKLMYFAFQICEEESCKEEATKIWADQEIRILDVCDKHYKQLEAEKFLL